MRLAQLIATPGWLTSAAESLSSWNNAADDIADRITGGYRPAGINLDVFEHLQQQFHRWPMMTSDWH